MVRRKNVVEFTTPKKALKYIHKIFPEDTEDQHGFIFQFKSLVQTAKSLSSQKSKGQLLTDGGINQELKSLISATDRYLEAIRKLKVSTKREIDREYTRDHLNPEEELPQSVKEDVLIGEYTLPLKNDESGKTRKTVQLGKLVKLLDDVKKYCQAGKLEQAGKEASEFKKLEWLLAQEYQNSGGKITEYYDGEFAHVLRAFHICSSIEEYDSNKIDNKYVKRIKKEANNSWEEQWRIEQ